jgi:hypothetical protein
VRIELKTEGGIAFFPGLAAAFAIDTVALAIDDAKRLAALVAESGLLDVPAAGRRGLPRSAGRAEPTPPIRRGADARRYVLTIDDGSRRRRVTVEDPVPAKLEPLVDFLRAKQRVSRRSPGVSGRGKHGG